jgi:hypothetical protein
MYFLHKDLWDLIQAAGSDKAIELSKQPGVIEGRGSFESELRAMLSGKRYEARSLPWIYWPVTSTLRFTSARKLLSLLMGSQLRIASPIFMGLARGFSQAIQQQNQARQQARQPQTETNKNGLLLLAGAAGLGLILIGLSRR